MNHTTKSIQSQKGHTGLINPNRCICTTESIMTIEEQIRAAKAALERLCQRRKSIDELKSRLQSKWRLKAGAFVPIEYSCFELKPDADEPYAESCWSISEVCEPNGDGDYIGTGRMIAFYDGPLPPDGDIVDGCIDYYADHVCPSCDTCNRPIDLEDKRVMWSHQYSPLFNRYGEQMTGQWCGMDCHMSAH